MKESDYSHIGINCRTKKSGYVYLIHGVGTPWYKVGLSKDPIRRTLNIGAGLPFPVRLVAYIATRSMEDEELSWHDAFQDWRVRGEWFALEPHAIELFCDHASRHGKVFKAWADS